MKVSLKNAYVDKNSGKRKLVYSVTGTPAELAAYKTARGEYYAEDTETKEPIYFTEFTSFGAGCEVTVTRSGNLTRADNHLAMLRDMLEEEHLEKVELAKIKAQAVMGSSLASLVQRVTGVATNTDAPANAAVIDATV